MSEQKPAQEIDEAAMARLHENGRKAWAELDGKSASGWVDEIRGNNDHFPDAGKKVGQDCEPIYQWRMNDGSWVDQTRSLYYSRVDAGEDKNRLRIVYAAPPKREPLSSKEIMYLMSVAGYADATPQEKADFINGARFAERGHCIEGQS